MGDPFLTMMLLLVFGPPALMGALYLAALLLHLAGRPGFLAMLQERTRFARFWTADKKED